MPDKEPVIGQRQQNPEESGGLITLGELESTIGRFLGMQNTRDALATHLGTSRTRTSVTGDTGYHPVWRTPAGRFNRFCLARTVLTTALHHRGLGPDAVLELLNRTSQAVQFNRELLESTLDNMSQGVAVVDKDLRLVGWNRRYLELMEYPEGHGLPGPAHRRTDPSERQLVA